MPAKGTPDRFWARGILNGECLEWTGSKNSDGYGTVKYHRKTYLVHRLAFNLKNGDIPQGFYVLHKCDNPKCFNPEHLRLGTQIDNMEDMRHRGRSNKLKEENHIKAILNREKVIQIRDSYSAGGVTQHELANRYGVSISCIKGVIQRKNWRNV